VDAAQKKKTALAYIRHCATRFLYKRDMLLTCARNRPAVRIPLRRDNGSGTFSLVKPMTANARVALSNFISAAESTAEARHWAATSRTLDPVCA